MDWVEVWWYTVTYGGPNYWQAEHDLAVQLIQGSFRSATHAARLEIFCV